MSFHKPHTCEHCLMYDQVAGGCKEQASPNWGGKYRHSLLFASATFRQWPCMLTKTEQSDGARYAHWMICATPPQGFISSQITNNTKNYE